MDGNKSTKLKLDADQARRLSILTAGRGNRRGKGIYNDKRRYFISQEEYENIKKLWNQGKRKCEIVQELNTTYYYINSTLSGKFDVLFKS